MLDAVPVVLIVLAVLAAVLVAGLAGPAVLAFLIACLLASLLACLLCLLAVLACCACLLCCAVLTCCACLVSLIAVLACCALLVCLLALLACFQRHHSLIWDAYGFHFGCIVIPWYLVLFGFDWLGLECQSDQCGSPVQAGILICCEPGCQSARRGMQDLSKVGVKKITLDLYRIS